MKKLFSLVLPLALLVSLFCFSVSANAAVDLSKLQTPAEASGWTRTTSSAEVNEFCKTVAANSNGRIRIDYTYNTELGTPLLYMIIGKPAPANPAAVDPNKAVVYVNCNIHSGEVEGKESMMIFAREVAQGKHDDLLKDLVIIINPNSNPDGNDNLGKNRITTQFMPKLVGTRSEGTGLNVNRDMTKLETVCARSIVKLMNDWDPVLFIDAHATDGSYMRHAITYNWGLNAGTDPELLAYNRDVFCTKALRAGSYLESQGKVAVPYGNWGYYYSDIVEEGWRTFEDYARYTTNYAGLQNRLSLLLEVYSYDEFSVRVDTQYACIYGALQTVAKDKVEIKQQIADAKARCEARATKGINPETDIVALNSEMTTMPFEGKEKLTVLSYATGEDGKVIGTRIYDEEGDPCGIVYGDPVDYETDYWGTFVPTKSEVMGAYYLLDADLTDAAEALLFHGVDVYQLQKDITLDAGKYHYYKTNSFNLGNTVIDGRVRSSYEGHYQVTANGDWTAGDKAVTIPAGTFLISTAQRLGSFAAMMCEPGCIDGLVAWNFCDKFVDAKAGTFRANFPVKVEGQATDICIPFLKVDDFGTLSTDGAKKLALFDDVSFNSAFYKGINYAYLTGMFNGKTATTFDSKGNVTRGQLAAVLYRMAGSPAVTAENKFSDVAAGKYYTNAVIWATENGIVTGFSDGTFRPTANVTRGQFATMLWRYAKLMGVDVSVGLDTNILSYEDALTMPKAFMEGMQWACGAGILTGSKGYLNYGSAASRGQVATMLYRFCVPAVEAAPAE